MARGVSFGLRARGGLRVSKSDCGRKAAKEEIKPRGVGVFMPAKRSQDEIAQLKYERLSAVMKMARAGGVTSKDVTHLFGGCMSNASQFICGLYDDGVLRRERLPRIGRCGKLYIYYAADE